MQVEKPTSETIRIILQKHATMVGLGKIAQVDCSLIGRGESNLNVLVTVNTATYFNLRIGLRGRESEQKLQTEASFLKLIPDGIGPRVFVVDVTRTDLEQPYLLLEYKKAKLKPVWSTKDLCVHARTLAVLHQPGFDGHGTIERLSNAPYDLLNRFDVAVQYWLEREPDLFNIPVVRRLLDPVRYFLAVRNSLFTSLHRFSIVHGDLHRLNILFYRNRPAYIDWESASIGDPALDLAMIGWDIETSWQMELKGERLQAFLEAYQEIEPDRSLPQRRDAWMIYTMFFDQLYHRTQIPGDTTGKQAYTVRQIESYLTGRFL